MYHAVAYINPQHLYQDMMIAAIKGGNLDLVKYFHHKGISLQHKFVHLAAVYNKLAIAQYMYKYLCDVIYQCINQYHEDGTTIEWLMKLGVNPPLHTNRYLVKACSFNLELVKLFESHCIDPLDLGFIEACKSGKIEIARYLRSKGANIYSYGNPNSTRRSMQC
jgi:hypothetical protein